LVKYSILDAIETIGLTPLTDYLSLFGGGWPMTLDNWDESNFDWQMDTASAFTTFNLPLLVDFFNDLDNKNTQRNVIYVDQETLFLPRSVLVDLEDNPDIAKAYIKLMVESAKTVRDWLRSNVSDDAIEVQAHKVLKFESQLAMVKNESHNGLL
jgi:predicted metalloendopeptidase